MGPRVCSSLVGKTLNLNQKPNAKSDSVVVENSIMHHPKGNDATAKLARLNGVDEKLQVGVEPALPAR